MYEKRHLVQIAEVLGVKQYINEKTVTEDVLGRVIAHNCKLDNTGIRITIQNAELDLNEADRQSLIEDLITAPSKQRGNTSLSNKYGNTSSSNNYGNTSLSNNYQTLMLVGQINSGLGWFMVIGCAFLFVFSAINGNPVGAGAGLAFLPISLLVVASGQAISCFVTTERNGKETTILLQKILDKMDAAG